MSTPLNILSSGFQSVTELTLLRLLALSHARLRNFGIQSYFMAASSLLFTFLYGLLAERHRLTSSSDSVNDPVPGGEDDDVKVCRSEGCFQGIMVCSVGATLAGIVGVAWLRKAWRGKT